MPTTNLDLERFHVDLFSNKSAEFKLNDTQRAFYRAVNEGTANGFSSNDTDPNLFIPVFVAAVALTNTALPVHLMVAKVRLPWVLEQGAVVARQIFRVRKGFPKESINVLRQSIDLIRISAKFMGTVEPDRWVMIGFKNTDTLPPWAAGRLLAPL